MTITIEVTNEREVPQVNQSQELVKEIDRLKSAIGKMGNIELEKAISFEEGYESGKRDGEISGRNNCVYEIEDKHKRLLDKYRSRIENQRIEINRLLGKTGGEPKI